jgi:fatty acid desaturase
MLSCQHRASYTDHTIAKAERYPNPTAKLANVRRCVENNMDIFISRMSIFGTTSTFLLIITGAYNIIGFFWGGVLIIILFIFIIFMLLLFFIHH